MMTKDERFISRYIVNAIYCIIWKYRDITIIRKYRDILTIFFMSDIDQFWSFMDLKMVKNDFFSCTCELELVNFCFCISFAIISAMN